MIKNSYLKSAQIYLKYLDIYSALSSKKYKKTKKMIQKKMRLMKETHLIYNKMLIMHYSAPSRML